MMDEIRIIETIQELVRIESVNPGLDPRGSGENRIAQYIAGLLRKMDLEAEVEEIGADRFNVYTVLKGTGGGRSLLLNGHMDTVGVEGMEDPFSGNFVDGRIFGRGAQDMKGGIAAMIAALESLRKREDPLKGDVIFTAVADEEYGSIGTEAVADRFRSDAAIVTEPTGLDVCIAHRGFACYDFETIGRAAHGGCPNEGIDANMNMAKVLCELDKAARNLKKKKDHPLLGKPSLHIPLIHGGTELFIYSERCKATCERRLLPGEDPARIEREFRKLLSGIRNQNPSFQATVRLKMARRAFQISENADIVRTLLKHAEKIRGRRPHMIGHPWWEDSALLAEKGMETVIIGPEGGGIHTHTEWVDVKSVVLLAEILTETITEYCA